MPFGIEMHHLYMVALMIFTFAFSFVVLAAPRFENEVGALLALLLPILAFLVDLMLIPYSFWDGGSLGAMLGLVSYFFIMFFGLLSGYTWRKGKGRGLTSSTH